MAIGYDATFEVDEFGKTKLKSEIETIKDVILYILYSKPGEYPSLPNIGLDIQTILYTFYDELDVADIKRKLIEQCASLSVYFDSSAIKITKTIYRDIPTLIIYINGKVTSTNYSSNISSSGYIIGLQADDIGHLITDVQPYNL